MRFGSVCSGIEAASVAFTPIGWEAAWFSEIEPFPNKVLAHHYPTVPNHGDMTTLPERILAGEVEAPDVLCGGTPCQAFSIAGLRGGLEDARGALTLTFCEIANAIDAKRKEAGQAPCIALWENVVGALSAPGNAFGCLLGALAGEDSPLEPAGGKWSNAGCVYGPERAVAWRVLDAQYFGVAQRRRRLFVVACPLERAHPTQILFEFEGLRGDTAPSRPTREDVAGTLTSRATGGGFPGTDEALSGYLQVAFGGNRTSGPLDVSTALNACGTASGRIDFASETFIVEGQKCFVKGTNPHSAQEAPTFRGTELAACLNGWDERHDPPKHMVVAFQSSQSGVRTSDLHATLDANNGSRRHNGVVDGLRVRRLMPVECERLQGFKDGSTDLPGASDSARYKALGNSWAIPCVAWIGRRIQAAAQAAVERHAQ